MLDSIISFYHYIEFLILYDFGRRFLRISLNVVFSMKIPENIQKISKKCLWTMRQDNRIRLFFFRNNLSVYCRILLRFLSSLLINFKKTTQMDDFERRLCSQTQELYNILPFYMSQIHLKIFPHNTTFSLQLPYIAGHSL